MDPSREEKKETSQVEPQINQLQEMPSQLLEFQFSNPVIPPGGYYNSDI